MPENPPEKRRGGRGRPCTVCSLPAKALDKLHRQHVRGVSMPKLAERFGLHTDAIARHLKNGHLPAEARKQIVLDLKAEAALAVDAEINADQVDIRDGLKRIVREIEAILTRAKGEDDALALTALRDMRATLVDLAKVYGQLKEQTTVTVSINEAPEWMRLRHILSDVFRDHPEAGRAFIERAQRERLSIAHV